LKIDAKKLSCSGSVAIALRDHKLWRLRWLNELLRCPIAIGNRSGANIQAWAGWGYKKSGFRAARIASKMGLPCWRLEDGFLRSVRLGNQDPPLSLVIDDTGMYYDASRASRLESCIQRLLTSDESIRAQALISAWRDGRVSKYNHLREHASFSSQAGYLPAIEGLFNKRYVLAADQTSGDASIRYGFAGSQSFNRMLQVALEENPQCTVLVKIHPDVFAGRKQGHFNLASLSRMDRVCLLGEDVHPVGLMEHAEAVYTVTSQIGFEGLLWGKRVRTFGMPFYAGWGLTEDDLATPERRGQATLEQLVHAALIDYSRYVNPETGDRCEVEEVLAHIALQRHMRERFPPIIYAMGFSIYKKPVVRRYFWGSNMHFVRKEGRKIPRGATLAIWGSTPPPAHMAGGVRLLRLEDGFLRSVGLGADLVRPLSWVMDKRGMYYDATAPSDLEHLLQNKVFTPDTIKRAQNIRKRIVMGGLTKYNVGVKPWRRPDSLEVRVILVPGQVETDASIRFGAPEIKANIDLLRAVRQVNPSAYVIYKPHPDVVAGLRKEGAEEKDAHRWCDEIVVDVAMHALIDAVDEVHVLTSLAGFEALLREKTVVVYGQPFYAGWGLTCDMVPVKRRTRKLSLDELVAGVLINYPTYVSRMTGRFTTPERALVELLEWKEASDSRLPWWRKGLRQVLRLRQR
jgi:capsular polysaccharide export protein